MNPYQEYLERVCTMYTTMHPDVDPGQVRQHIQELTDRNFRDIPCYLHNNISNERINTSVCNTFDWIEQRSPIITGNGTFFKQHSEYLAPIVVMLETLKSERKDVKKKMYQYDKKSIEYQLLNTEQGSIKVIMNADYGGSGTTLSPFYSCYIPPATTGSARVMTTTLICCLEMLTNNQNKWAKIQNINGLYDFIYTILNDTEERKIINVKYTIDEVKDALLEHVVNYSLEDILYLKAFLATLTDEQRTKLRLAFHVRYVLTEFLAADMKVVSDYMKTHQIDWNNVTKETLQVSGFGPTIPEEIKEYMDRISQTILDNCCYPFILNDNEVRAAEMERLIVCVTDTDSLMVHFAAYIDEFQTRTSNFRDSCIMASAIGMRLYIENIIPRMVKYLTIGCNIKDEYYRKKFVFKNEFGFLAMALIAKKMYASSMFVQEGSPREIHDIAVSGLSFKKRDAAEFLEDVMVHLYDKYILTADHVSVHGILDEYYALREKLRAELDTNPKYYQVQSLKDISAYDASKILPEQMRGAIIWNQMMPEEEMLPMDRVIVIRLSFELMEKYAPENLRVAELLRLSLINNQKKDHAPYICLPEHYKTIPDWIRIVIDKEGCIDKLLTPFKQLLSLFDVMVAETKAGAVSSRMIYL